MRIYYSLTVFFLLFLNSIQFFSQKTAYYSDGLKDYNHALELYYNKAYAASKQAFIDVRDRFTPFSEMRANCDYYIANCAVRLDEYNADALITDFVDSYPNATKRNDAFIDIAYYYYDTGKYAQALKWLKRINAKNLPHNAYENYMFRYGYALFATGNYLESKKYFVQLLDSETYGSQAKYYYGYVAYEQDDYENADKYLGQVSEDAQYKKDVSYYMADMNFKLGKFQSAIEAGLPLLKTASPAEKSEINKIVGESYFNLGQYDKAIPYLKDYKGKNGKWTNTDYYLLGYSYYKQNDYINAIEQFNKIIDGNNAVAQNAYYHLAECYLKTNKKSEALNAFRNASQMDFKPQIQEDAYLNYAKLSYEIGNPYENVADVLQNFVKRYPNSPENKSVKNLIVSAYTTANDYEGAIKYMEKEKLNTKNELYQKVAFMYGVQLYSKAKYHLANTSFDKSLSNAVNPIYTAKATYWKGEAEYQLNNFSEAIQDFTNFKNLNEANKIPEFQSVDYQLGYAYFKKKDYVASAYAFDKFLGNAKVDTEKRNDAFLRLGDAYFMTSQYKKAIEAYQNASKLLTKTADYALFQSAICNGFINKNEQKISLLLQLISTYPKSTYADDAYYVLGTTYTAINQNVKALESYDSLIDNYPKSSLVPRALLKKGLIYFNENQPDKAIEVYKLAVKQYPNSPFAQEAVQNARQIYIDTGRVDEYAVWVKNLDFINVSNSELDNDMYEAAEKQFLLNEYAKSIPLFRKYLQSFPNGMHALDAHFYLAQALENQGKDEETLLHYQYIVDQSQNQYTEQALVKLSQIYLDKKDWAKATPILQKLEQVADHSQNVLYAQSNLMKSYYNNENYTQAVIYAEKVLNNSLVDNKVKADAQIIIARAALKSNDLTKARNAYKQLENVATHELKAEALYYDAFFKNRDGDYKNSNKVVQIIASDYAAYKYWGAKGLIVMAKNFNSLKDAYQATYILENVIKNFTQYPDVITEAQTELKKIKSEQAKTNDSVIEE